MQTLELWGMPAEVQCLHLAPSRNSMSGNMLQHKLAAQQARTA